MTNPDGLAMPLMKPGIDSQRFAQGSTASVSSSIKFISALMAALMSMLVLFIVDVLMDVLLTRVLVCVFVLIIIVATHLDSPPFFCNCIVVN